MITRSKLRIGEGMLEDPDPQIGSRRSQSPQNPPIMAHEEGQEMMFEDERDFRKDFYDMSK